MDACQPKKLPEWMDGIKGEGVRMLMNVMNFLFELFFLHGCKLYLDC